MPIDIAGNKINKNAVKIHSHDGIVKRGLVCHIDSTDLNEKSDTVGDLSGNNNNGTTYTGTCLRFDGSNDYVESTSSILRTLEGVTRYSVSMWVNSDVTGAYDSFWGISNTHELHIYTNNLFYFWHNGGASCIGGSLAANTWTFITATYSVDTQKLYQNGAIVDTETQSQGTSPTAGTTNMFVGKMTGNHFDGKMADIKVWNEVLTDGEIMELYKTPNLIVPSGMSTDVLELWWPLSEGYGTVAYDASGHGHHGTLTNGVAWEGGQTDIPQLTGKNFSQKMIFDGSNDYLSYGDVNLPNGSAEVSLSCWIYPTTAGDYGVFGYGSGTTDTTFEIYLYNHSGTIRPAVHYAGGNSGYTNGLGLNLNKWNHIAATYDKTSSRIYVNGELSITDAQTLNIATSYRRIGAQNYGSSPGEFFLGQIDECAIWNTVLTINDIKALSATSNKTVLERSHIHNHKGAFVEYGAPLPPDARQIASNNLVGYWRNEGNAIWQDLSRSGNDGTVNGSPNTLVFPEGHIEGRDSNGFPSKVNCLAFYGSDRGDYVSISGFGSLSTRTVDFWYKFTGGIITGGGDNVLFSDGSGWQGLDVVDDNNGSTAQLRWHTVAGGNPGALRTTGLKVNTWYHAAFAADSSGWELFHNGVSQGTNGTTSTQSSTVVIGTRADQTYPYSGLVSAFKIYDRRLSAEEVKHNYRVDSERFNVQNY